MKHDIILFGELSSLFFGDISVLSVYFVGQQGDDDTFTPLMSNIINPLLNAFKGSLIGYIIDYNSNGSISNIIRNKSPKSFLPCSIPELQSNGLIFEKDVL
eukprot:GHVR01105626.1.p1 GENE.GHVR01105626.1~~GHVR01105626.1.p1  ORF type:complete len:101 (+),score=2.99 GHVR01105626.1:3000-3302(+)